ncbi:MAG: hypothetical protein FKY71_17210 [Spiribacter salinus]|uniref:Uncharacterized protein n=1 Tax=Spiribacter salinus TaxID=1335746 RepID=A0A540VEZ0_9GAMM|nr:MAG: hypothetical protein FKY71_17210 [Spiribacter salinus]
MAEVKLRLQSGMSEQEVKQCVCPECGSEFEISFPSDGKAVAISCSKDPFHLSGMEVIDFPLPAWWRSRIDDAGWLTG